MTNTTQSMMCSDQPKYIAGGEPAFSVFLFRGNQPMPVEAKIISLTREQMIPILKEWRECVKGLLEDQTLSQDVRKRFTTCNKVMASSLVELNSTSDKKIYAIELNSKIEGVFIGTIKKNKSTFYVDSLATAPKNLSPSPEQSQIMGVGRALFDHAVEIAKCNQLSYLSLRFYDGAEGFYKKMGMSQTENGFELKIKGK